jgi:ubiquinone/menaquinone biosynthesis C-methylase UbiE
VEIKRKPFQGILNIIRFNRHFYLFAGALLIGSFLLIQILRQPFAGLVIIGVAVAAFSIVVSLLVSYYVYDLSGLYQLKWLDISNSKMVLNINAGFDETSEIIQARFPNSKITICDFYDPAKHTEISIKRARKIFPPNPRSIPVSTEQLPFPENTFDKTLAILSAHEIRDKNERIQFFKELNRITKGQIFVTEHLRDINNFLAYAIGAFHFHSRKSWLETFEQANLIVKQEIKITPFITTFLLEKYGNTF